RGRPLLGDVLDVAFRPDGRHLVSCGSSILGGVRVWDLRTGQLLQTLTEPTLQFNAVAYSPDGEYLAAAGHDPAVRVWHAQGYHEAFRLPGLSGWVNGLAFSQNGRLAAASQEGKVKIWDVKSGPDAALLVPARNSTRCTGIAFSPTGRWVALASGKDRTVYLREVATDRPGPSCRGHAAE